MAKDKKDAIRIAINAGIDMSMDPYSVEFCVLLKELVNEGKVKMSRIDDAVRRILRAKYRLGLFDEPNTGGKGFEKFGCEEFAQASLTAARGIRGSFEERWEHTSSRQGKEDPADRS